MTQQELAFDNPELAKRDQGMAIAAESKSPILDWLRVAIRNRWKDLVKRGLRDYVTADDARILLEIAFDDGRFERPQGKFNFMGSVFRKGWRKVPGEKHQSETDGSHGNDIYRWEPVDAEELKKELLG